MLKNIFVHCSASPWGEVLIFNTWHKARGWRGVGYHYIILNGRPFVDITYLECLDGQIEPGRALDDDPIYEDHEIGAHVAGRNRSSIGICLVGEAEFTNKQLNIAKNLLLELIKRFNLSIDDILGHYEDPHTNKSCPNVSGYALRDFIADNISIDQLQLCIKAQMCLGYKNLIDKNDKEWYTNWKDTL